MIETTPDPAEIEAAALKFNQYVGTVKNFQPPVAHIQIDDDSNGNTHVHIDVEHKGTQLAFESIQEKDADDIHRYLNSQPIVRRLYGTGVPLSLEATNDRVKTLVERFHNKESPMYLFSGFIVSDAQTDEFIGMATIGAGSENGTCELGFLNRVEFWSHIPDVSSDDTQKNDEKNRSKTYSGIGTMEICTLLQYGAYLKERGFQVNGHEVKAIDAFAIIQNEGSWKSCAKAGMALHDVTVVPHYNQKLRYHLRKEFP